MRLGGRPGGLSPTQGHSVARIRTIKPEFFTSEDIVRLSPLARLLYVALWCEADREGRLEWKPRTFKIRYLPADDCDVEKLAQELILSGLVVLYDECYAYIPRFLRHQHINPRESASTLPDPHASRTRRSRVDHASSRVGHAQGGRERKGKEVIPPLPPTGGDGVDPDPKSKTSSDFSTFWSAYPRKVAKASAMRAFTRIRPDDEKLARMLSALDRQKRSEAWSKDGGQFIPHAATWLRGERWEDAAPGFTRCPEGPDDAERTAQMLARNTMTPEQREAANEARKRIMQAVRVVT